MSMDVDLTPERQETPHELLARTPAFAEDAAERGESQTAALLRSLATALQKTLAYNETLLVASQDHAALEAQYAALSAVHQACTERNVALTGLLESLEAPQPISLNPDDIVDRIVLESGLESNVVRQLLTRAVIEARIGWSPDTEEKGAGA